MKTLDVNNRFPTNYGSKQTQYICDQFYCCNTQTLLVNLQRICLVGVVALVAAALVSDQAQHCETPFELSIKHCNKSSRIKATATGIGKRPLSHYQPVVSFVFKLS